MRITVKEFIKVNDILNREYETEMDKEINVLCYLTDKEEDYFLSLSMKDYKKERAILSRYDLKDVKAKAERVIKANGHYYFPVFDFSMLTAGQLVDSVTFGREPEKIIENLSKILASFCVPGKRGLFGIKKLRYGAVDHAQVAEDMETLDVFQAYAIASFFFQVWKAFLRSTGDCIVREILRTKMNPTQKEREALLSILSEYGDGIAMRKELHK